MKEYLIKSYKNKKVFVTGHTGFKGSWLLLFLNHLAADVKGYSLAPEEEPSLYRSINGDQYCTSVIADIRDKERLKKELVEFQPDFVFHLAAQPLVIEGYLNPTETFEVNAMGTAHLLDALRDINSEIAVVIITTDKVYEDKEWYYPYRENDRLGGSDPYSASKSIAELIVKSYRESYFIESHIRVATARAGNVIGGGDWAVNRIVPDIIRSLSKNETIKLRNPEAIRPWQPVLDPLYGYLILGARLMGNDGAKLCEGWNFGPGMESFVKVKELTKLCIDFWGEGECLEQESPNKYKEMSVLTLDSSKSMRELGWRPQMSCEEAIRQLIQDYKNIMSGSPDLLHSGVEDYLNRLK